MPIPIPGIGKAQVAPNSESTKALLRKRSLDALGAEVRAFRMLSGRWLVQNKFAGVYLQQEVLPWPLPTLTSQNMFDDLLHAMNAPTWETCFPNPIRKCFESALPPAISKRHGFTFSAL